MRVSLATTALLITSVAARATFFSSSPTVDPYDEDLTVPGKNPLLHCEDPKDDILDLKNVDLDPNPPLAGTTLNITATGELSETVGEGAKIHLQVKYGVIRIISQEVDLCDNVGNVGLKCPLEKDKEVELTKQVELPKEIPPGKYTVLADIYTKDQKKVTCLTATVQFTRGGSDQQILGEWKQGL